MKKSIATNLNGVPLGLTRSKEILAVVKRYFPDGIVLERPRGIQIHLKYKNTLPVTVEDEIDLIKFDWHLSNLARSETVSFDTLRTLIQTVTVPAVKDVPTRHLPDVSAPAGQPNRDECFGTIRTPVDGSRMITGLFLNGGGVKGVIEGVVLSALMDRVNKDQPPTSPLHPTDVFNQIFGTSTGAIVGAGLCIPEFDGQQYRPKYWPNDIIKIYSEDGPAIFKPYHNAQDEAFQWPLTIPTPNFKLGGLVVYPDVTRCQPTQIGLTVHSLWNAVESLTGWTPSRELIQPRFSGKSVRETLFTKFGNTMVDDAAKLKQTKFVAIAYSMSYRQDYVIGPGMGFSMVQAASSSGAAPSFFPPVVYDNDVLVDGGIVANCPGLHAYQSLVSTGRQPVLVGIGCGYTPPSDWDHVLTDLSNELGGVGAIGPQLFKNLMHNSTFGPLCHLERLMGDTNRFHYFDVMLPDHIGLDDLTKVPHLIAEAESYVDASSNRLDRLADVLIDHAHANKGLSL